MSGATPHSGSVRRTAGGIEGRLERHFDHPLDQVWRMLIEPSRFAQWLAPGFIEPRPGGAVRIDFRDSGTVIDSTILEFEPPHVLAYSWSHGDEPARPLRWQLRGEAGAGTHLALELCVPAGEDAARALAGFEGHLEMLAAALEGVPIRFPVDLFLAARAAYRERLAADPRTDE